jgi:MFS family permease
VRPLRRNRDFTLLWSGQVVSTIGTQVSAIAFPLLVLALTHSPRDAGIVGFARGLPYLLLFLPAGVYVDRWNRKLVMLAADAGRAVALGSVAVWLALGRPPLAWLAIVAFVEGALFVFFQLSENAALPFVVAREHLPQAIARNQARQQGARFAGAPLGGLLYGLSHLLPFAADAASYAVSFVSLLFVRPAFQGERTRVQRSLRDEVVEGLLWLKNQRFMRVITGLVTVSNFVHQALGLVLIVRARDLGASPSLIGVMLGIGGAGSIAGALVAPTIQRLVSPPRVVIGCLWIWVAQMAALGFAPSPLALGVIGAAGFVTGPVVNTAVGSYTYALVPEEIYGRVSAASGLFAWGSMPLGSLFAGFLLGAVSARTALFVLAGILFLLALVGSGARDLRKAPVPEAIPPPVTVPAGAD